MIGLVYAALGWVAIVVVAVVGFLALRRLDRHSAKMLEAIKAPFDERMASLVRRILATEPLLRNGQATSGRIVDVAGTGVTFQGDDNDVVRVTVEVASPAGPYRAECVMWILGDDRPRFEPGSVHELRVDPQDPTRIALAGTPYETLRWLAQRSSWGARL